MEGSPPGAGSVLPLHHPPLRKGGAFLGAAVYGDLEESGIEEEIRYGKKHITHRRQLLGPSDGHRNQMWADDFCSRFGSISLAISRNSSRNPAKGYQVLFSTNVIIVLLFLFPCHPWYLSGKLEEAASGADESHDAINMLFCK